MPHLKPQKQEAPHEILAGKVAEVLPEAQRVYAEIVKRLRLVVADPVWSNILRTNEVYVGGSLARTLLGLKDKLFTPGSDVDIFIWTGGIYPISSMVLRDLEGDLRTYVNDYPIRIHSPTADEWKTWVEQGEPLIRILL